MSPPFVEDAFFFPLYIFSFFVKNQVFIGLWINIWIFDSIILVNLSVLMSITSIFHYHSSTIELISEIVMPPAVPLLHRIVLIILGIFVFCLLHCPLPPAHLMLLVPFSLFNLIHHRVLPSFLKLFFLMTF